MFEGDRQGGSDGCESEGGGRLSAGKPTQYNHNFKSFSNEKNLYTYFLQNEWLITFKNEKNDL